MRYPYFVIVAVVGSLFGISRASADPASFTVVSGSASASITSTNNVSTNNATQLVTIGNSGLQKQLQASNSIGENANLFVYASGSGLYTASAGNLLNAFDYDQESATETFTVGQGITNYSISGNGGSGTPDEYAIQVILKDLTSNTLIYSYQFDRTPASGSTSFTLDSTGGSLTGTLTDGDEYQYSINDKLGAGPTSSAADDDYITLALSSPPVPEPAGISILILSACGLCLRRPQSHTR